MTVKCGECGTPFVEEEGMLCDCYDYLCEGCGARLEDMESQYCMPCQVDAAEQQGFRWGEDR